ncbi:MAG: hypothetical protein CBB71_14325 [Rhodopirellula sp. TMED11]|nr:MAG: hypothetical protein CBB71_14325 [Rhodopirellula sp. TMED11]
MDGFDDDEMEIVKEFLVESYESLDELDQNLMALEDRPDDRERLGSIFRTVHTIKGTSGFLALNKLERVAHVGENLLVKLRDGRLSLTHDIADGLLGMVDAIRAILANLEQIGNEGDADYEALILKLQELLHGADAGTQPSQPPAEQTPESIATEPVDPPPEPPQLDSEVNDELTTELDAQNPPEPQAIDNETALTNHPDDLLPTTDKPASEDEPVLEPATEGPAQDAPTAPIPTPHVSNAAPVSEQPQPDQTPPKVNKDPQTATPTLNSEDKGTSDHQANKTVADASVRIDVEILDKLMNLVGELVLSRNEIVQFCSRLEDARMNAASQRLNLITTELQEGVMKTRMQPIRNAWSKLPRVVRDLSATLGKQVEVQMFGADTELDKTVLEAIKDPLTHIVRNSVDHGIESPEQRIAAGKPGLGTLSLRAFHEGGQVNIEIADDGGGINAERIREKAVEKGVVAADVSHEMSERELINLILLPGFSTAQKVTNVSGRGVGMDVVKTNIEQIGGTLDIQSVAGKGTTLRIKIPLTLAIVPALMVTVDDDHYAIPQVNLMELVRLSNDRVNDEIEYIHNVPVYRLRGNLLPLVYLDEELEVRERRKQDRRNEDINIVVLRADSELFGLVVDSITDTQEIVVKPLGQNLKAIPAYAGATIMGDGHVALILDVLGLAQKSHVLAQHRDRSVREKPPLAMSRSSEQEELLVVESHEGLRAAIRLSSVARLEEFPVQNVEHAGSKSVVQYRGEILPLIDLTGGPLHCAPMDDEDDSVISTVVFSQGDQNVGVVVGKIVDIVAADISVETKTQGNSRIIKNRVTEMVNLQHVVQASGVVIC